MTFRATLAIGTSDISLGSPLSAHQTSRWDSVITKRLPRSSLPVFPIGRVSVCLVTAIPSSLVYVTGNPALCSVTKSHGLMIVGKDKWLETRTVVCRKKERKMRMKFFLCITEGEWIMKKEIKKMSHPRLVCTQKKRKEK